jgi:hypothetical protein
MVDWSDKLKIAEDVVSTSPGLIEVLYQRLTEGMMETTTDISQLPGNLHGFWSLMRVDNVPSMPSHMAVTYHLRLLSQSGWECKGYDLSDVAPRSFVARYLKLNRNVGTRVMSLSRVSEDSIVHVI